MSEQDQANGIQFSKTFSDEFVSETAATFDFEPDALRDGLLTAWNELALGQWHQSRQRRWRKSIYRLEEMLKRVESALNYIAASSEANLNARFAIAEVLHDPNAVDGIIRSLEVTKGKLDEVVYFAVPRQGRPFTKTLDGERVDLTLLRDFVRGLDLLWFTKKGRHLNHRVQQTGGTTGRTSKKRKNSAGDPGLDFVIACIKQFYPRIDSKTCSSLIRGSKYFPYEHGAG